MCSFIELIATIISLYYWLIIIQVVLSWLVAFNVVNTQNRVVYTIGDFLYRVTEPALAPIRRFMPNLGGIDVSPVILIFVLFFLQNFIREVSGCSHFY
ncbi:MAG: YggT family protein [Alphaproteobacteria bacterium]|jgi:YggT family protein|nr:YggT family protein [Alphaproteobacteria bacterium]MDP6563600.1 YggT family protein [Alphaproteobacteria bacterium]MDP6815087.1 YggT family protein [Alphaproteobacteria bacterium]|tara:strand:- start:35 stop:328 length:294 start_codon:yes stop_codon:yes gene_type:complete